MSPTILRIGKYRFYFNSREEKRMHIHIQSPDGEAKFWIEPIVSLADFYNIKRQELNKIEKHVQENVREIVKAWKKHFRS